MLKKVLFIAFVLVLVTSASVDAQQRQILKNAKVVGNGNIYFQVSGALSWFFVDPKGVSVEISDVDGTYVVCEFEAVRPCLEGLNRNISVNGLTVYVKNLKTKDSWSLAIQTALTRKGHLASDVVPDVVPTVK